MAILAVVAVLVVIALGALAVPVWRGRAPAQFILGVLPLALLFVTVPIIPSLQQVIGGFVQMSDGGTGGDPGRTQIVMMVGVAAQQLSLAVAAFLVAMWAAAALQRAATKRQRALKSEEALPRGEKSWGGFVLAASSMLSIPVGWVAYSAVQLLRALTLVSAGRTTADLDTIARAAFGVSEGEASRLISDHLIRIILAATVLSPLLVVFAIGGVVVILRRKVPSILAPYSWLVLAAVSLAGVVALVELSAEAHWFGPAA